MSGVHPAAEIAGEEPEEDAERRRDQHGAAADGDGDACAVEDRREEVAALVVGAEQEARIAVGREGRRELGVGEVVGRDVGRVRRG